MSIRNRRLLYTATLLAPVVVVGLNAPPFVQTTQAQLFTQGLFGPNFPALLDTNGNGVPDSGDTPATPTRVGNVVTLVSPLDCNTGDGDNQGTLSGNLNGRLNTLSRNSDFGRTQELQVTSANGDQATGFGFTERSGGTAVGTGTGGLADGDGDGAFEQFSGNGSTSGGRAVGSTFDLVFGDANNDGHSDYVSMPWAFSSFFGVDPTDGCGAGGAGGTDPQVWIPLADSNGDTFPDAIIPDLDGNGVPDGDSFRSPPLVSAAVVPTMTTWWTTLLTVLLSGASLWALRRRQSEV